MTQLDRYLAVTMVTLVVITLLSIMSATIFILNQSSIEKSGIDIFYLVYLPFLSVLLIILFSAAFGLATLYVKMTLEAIDRPGNLEEILQFDPVCLQCIQEAERQDIMDRLETEKRRIDHIINLAESKYHMRKIDERSFHEILKEQQKKLMDIETKMEEMRDQLAVIESRGKEEGSAPI
jgi:hypothetical protein